MRILILMMLFSFSLNSIYAGEAILEEYLFVKANETQLMYMSQNLIVNIFLTQSGQVKNHSIMKKGQHPIIIDYSTKTYWEMNLTALQKQREKERKVTLGKIRAKYELVSKKASKIDGHACIEVRYRSTVNMSAFMPKGISKEVEVQMAKMMKQHKPAKGPIEKMCVGDYPAKFKNKRDQIGEVWQKDNNFNKIKEMNVANDFKDFFKLVYSREIKKSFFLWGVGDKLFNKISITNIPAKYRTVPKGFRKVQNPMVEMMNDLRKETKWQ